jgi:leucyl-tRNA synthetase
MIKKEYVCVMFPYPSGAGLHVGHYYNYAIVDSICRWKRYNSTVVFQPFGYDAFGLPAENYARKVGRDPKEVTLENINNFRAQMIHMNTEYQEKLITCDNSYVKWTQFVFKKLCEHDLAYKKNAPVNYCSSCETVLANEQVVDSRCERCNTVVELKTLNQWFFKITDYRDRLIKNLDIIDYPSSTKEQQRHWLKNMHDWCVSRQRSWGCPIPIEGETDTLDTFVDSSFYYLRYLTDSQDQLIPAEDYHQVDLYVGGSEHANMHLIYARFIHMFLYDIGLVPVEEPFKKVIHQGMITKDNNKMSKSKGNTVDPTKYDSDVLRMYLMFIGPYDHGGDWNDQATKGIVKFLNRMNNWLSTQGDDYICLDELKSKISKNIDSLKVNKIVSDFMIFYNQNKHKKPSNADEIRELLQIFAPGFDLSKKY